MIDVYAPGRHPNISIDDRQCIHNLMRQFRDSKPGGLKASRRLDVVISIVDTLVRREREWCAKAADQFVGLPEADDATAKDIATKIRERKG